MLLSNNRLHCAFIRTPIKQINILNGSKKQYRKQNPNIQITVNFHEMNS